MAGNIGDGERRTDARSFHLESLNGTPLSATRPAERPRATQQQPDEFVEQALRPLPLKIVPSKAAQEGSASQRVPEEPNSRSLTTPFDLHLNRAISDPTSSSKPIKVPLPKSTDFPMTSAFAQLDDATRRMQELIANLNHITSSINPSEEGKTTQSSVNEIKFSLLEALVKSQLRSNAINRDLSQTLLRLATALTDIQTQYDGIAQDNRHLAFQNREVYAQAQASTEKLIRITLRHIRGEPPSKEEYEVVLKHPLAEPKSKTSASEKSFGALGRCQFIAESLHDRAVLTSKFQAMLPSNGPLLLAAINRESLSEFLSDPISLAEDLPLLLATPISLRWVDVAGILRLPHEGSPKSLRVGLPPYDIAGNKTENDKFGSKLSQASTVPLAVALLFLAISRGDFQDAGRLIAADPLRIARRAIALTAPGAIFRPEAIAWAIKILCEMRNANRGQLFDNLENMIVIVQHMFTYLGDEQRGSIRSTAIAIPRQEAKAGKGRAAHNDPDYIEALAPLLELLPPGDLPLAIDGYAFTLAVVQCAFDRFHDDIKTHDESTKRRAELVISGIANAFNLIIGGAAVAPGGSAGTSIGQSATAAFQTFGKSAIERKAEKKSTESLKHQVAKRILDHIETIGEKNTVLGRLVSIKPGAAESANEFQWHLKESFLRYRRRAHDGQTKYSDSEGRM